MELAQKIADQAGVGEILASRTVKDLVAGSGINFADNSVKSFPEINGEWRIFTVKR